MRVDILSSPETVQAARTTSLTAGSRSPSFSEAMSRTSPGESLKAASKGAPTPSGPLPATKSAAEPNLPAQTSQAARAVQLSNTGVRSDAGANTKCEVQSDVKLDSKAGAQAAPQSTSKAALKVVAKASPDANMSSANTSSAKAGVTVTGIPGPQVAGAASVMTSAILPATLFAALPVAALPTSNALPASNVPLLGATSTAARGPSPTAGSTANPTPVVPSVAVPSFVSPVISTALAPSAIASAGRPIATQVSTSAQSNSGEQVSSMARRTVANNSGLDLPAAHLSTPSADFTAQSLSPAPANGSNTPPLTTLGPVQGASDPGSGSTRPATPDAVDHADALLKDVAGPEVGTKATVDNANSFDSAFRFPVSNAAVGDVPHLRSEPASPTPALPLADAAAPALPLLRRHRLQTLARKTTKPPRLRKRSHFHSPTQRFASHRRWLSAHSRTQRWPTKFSIPQHPAAPLPLRMGPLAVPRRRPRLAVRSTLFDPKHRKALSRKCHPLGMLPRRWREVSVMLGQRPTRLPSAPPRPAARIPTQFRLHPTRLTHRREIQPTRLSRPLQRAQPRLRRPVRNGLALRGPRLPRRRLLLRRRRPLRRPLQALLPALPSLCRRRSRTSLLPPRRKKRARRPSYPLRTRCSTPHRYLVRAKACPPRLSAISRPIPRRCRCRLEFTPAPSAMWRFTPSSSKARSAFRSMATASWPAGSARKWVVSRLGSRIST